MDKTLIPGMKYLFIYLVIFYLMSIIILSCNSGEKELNTIIEKDEFVKNLPSGYTLRVVAKANGLTGSSETVKFLFSDSTHHFSDSILFYTDELFFKLSAKDSLLVFTPYSSISNNLNLKNKGLKIKIYALKTKDEVEYYSNNYLRMNLNRASIYK